jgi:hypothetical protein
MTAYHIPVTSIFHIWSTTSKINDHGSQDALLFLIEQVLDFLKAVVAGVGVYLLDSLSVDPSVTTLLVRQRTDLLAFRTIDVDK